MKLLKIFTKTATCLIVSSMFFSTILSATENANIPNLSKGASEYSNMVTKAKVFGDLQSVVVDGFTKECINEPKIDKAIENAKLAASEINTITFLRLDNAPYSGPYSFEKNVDDSYFPKQGSSSKVIPCVRDNGKVYIVNDYLKKASLGQVSLNLKSKASNKLDGVITTDEYFDSLFFSVSHDLIEINFNKYILDFKSNNIEKLYSFSEISTDINQYADFLSSLKLFYEATGCYDKTTNNKTNKTSNKNNTTSKAKKKKATAADSSSIKDAVITADDKTIKVGDSFVFMKGVKAVDNGGKGDDITNKISVSGRINTLVPGIYKVTYTVKGENGNTMYKDVEVTVNK